MKTKKPLLITGTVLVSVYMVAVLVSYFYLPHKLKTIVESDVAAMLGRDVTVDEFRFNPFSLELTCHGLAVSDAPHQPIVAFSSLSVDVGFWSSLFKFYPVIESIEWVEPSINIRKQAEGFNFDSILAQLTATTPEQQPEEQQTSSPLRLMIENIRVQSGATSYFDTSQSVPADAHLENINISFANLYIATGADSNNPFSIVTKLSNGGTIALEGEYRAQPLFLDSQITLSDLALSEVSDFLRNTVHANLQGELSGSSHINVQQHTNRPLALIIDNTDLTISDLSLDDLQQGPPVVSINTLQAEGISVDLTEQLLTIDALTYDGLTLNQWRDNVGNFRYQSLMVRTAQPEESKDQPMTTQAADTVASPWQVRLGAFVINNSQMLFTDNTVEPAAHWNLTDINVLIQPLHLTSDTPSPMQVSAILNETTNLSLDGEFSVLPFGLRSNYNLSDFPLSSVNAYLAEVSHAVIRQGQLSTSGTLAMTNTPDLTVDLTNNLAIHDVDLENLQTHSDVLSFARLTINDTHVKIPDNKVSISAIELVDPTVTLEQTQQPNWLLAKESGDSAQPEDEPKNSGDDATRENTFAAKVDSITIDNGNINFSDAMVTPTLKTTVNEINFNTGNINTQQAQAAAASLSAMINHQAPFKVNAEFTPSDAQAIVKGQLQSLDLRNFSQYTGEFIGFATDSGQLNYDFDYTLAGTKVDGKNRIKAERFYLGDKVDSKSAIQAPVKLGMSLLRDIDGNIILDLDISGDRSDPSFSVGGLLAKALTNILIKVAASPFTMLGSLMNSDQDLSSVSFTPGSDELTPQAQQTLQALAKALQSKPALTLVLQGNATPGADAVELARQQVIHQITPEQTVAHSELGTWLEENERELIHIFNQRGTGAYSDLRNSYREQIDDNDSADNQALIRAYDLLVQDITIAPATLVELANKRSSRIQAFLASTPLNPEQLQVLPASEEALNNSVITFTLKAD